LWLTAVAAAVLACSSRGGPVDGATAQPCTGAEVCQGSVLYACLNGQLGNVIQDCTPLSCADNQCTPTACAAAVRGLLDFWVLIT
jgi:hypothetical protein